jgi:hypothetical protein
MSFALARLGHATLTAARLLAVTCVLSGGLVALGTTPRAHAVGHATHPGTNGRIVFMTRVMDNGELHDQIYSMNADGSDQRRLTNNPGYDQGPTWSKDGKKIAFTSSRYGTGDVFVMNADSSNQRQVTTGANAHWAKLSPDGMKIAYQGYVDHNYEIFVVNTDGTGLRRLTHNPGASGRSAGAGAVCLRVPARDRLADADASACYGELSSLIVPTKWPTPRPTYILMGCPRRCCR